MPPPQEDKLLLERANPHPRDERIVFDEPSHKYTLDGSLVFSKSVSGLVHDNFPEFDAKKIVNQYYSNWGGQQGVQVLQPDPLPPPRAWIGRRDRQERDLSQLERGRQGGERSGHEDSPGAAAACSEHGISLTCRSRPRRISSCCSTKTRAQTSPTRIL